MYYALKRRQLRRSVANAEERMRDVFRPDAEPSSAAGAPSALRARRGLPQITLRLPVSRTNLEQGASVEFMYSFCMPCSNSFGKCSVDSAASSRPGSAFSSALSSALSSDGRGSIAKTSAPAAQLAPAAVARQPLHALPLPPVLAMPPPPVPVHAPRVRPPTMAAAQAWPGFPALPAPPLPQQQPGLYVASAPIPIPHPQSGASHKRRLSQRSLDAPTQPSALPPLPLPAGSHAPLPGHQTQRWQGWDAYSAAAPRPRWAAAAGPAPLCHGPAQPLDACGADALHATLRAIQASLATC